MARGLLAGGRERHPAGPKVEVGGDRPDTAKVGTLPGGVPHPGVGPGRGDPLADRAVAGGAVTREQLVAELPQRHVALARRMDDAARWLGGGWSRETPQDGAVRIAAAPSRTTPQRPVIAALR